MDIKKQAITQLTNVLFDQLKNINGYVHIYIYGKLE